jgi:hypothetical protein
MHKFKQSLSRLLINLYLITVRAYNNRVTALARYLWLKKFGGWASLTVAERMGFKGLFPPSIHYKLIRSKLLSLQRNLPPFGAVKFLFQTGHYLMRVTAVSCPLLGSSPFRLYSGRYQRGFSVLVCSSARGPPLISVAHITRH